MFTNLSLPTPSSDISLLTPVVYTSPSPQGIFLSITDTLLNPLCLWLSILRCIPGRISYDFACSLKPCAGPPLGMDALSPWVLFPQPLHAWILTICTRLAPHFSWIPTSPTQNLTPLTGLPSPLEAAFFILLELWHHMLVHPSVEMLLLPLWAIPVCCFPHLAWSNLLHGHWPHLVWTLTPHI